MLKPRAVLSCFFLLTILATVSDGAAQTTCSSHLSYTWTRTTEGDAVDAKGHVVPWGRIDRAGSDEAQAKYKLENVIIREKVRALEACKGEHENLSGCTATRFSAMSTTLSALSFSARKALEDAISSDCKGVQGSCGEPASTEITCVTAAPKEETPAAGDKKAADDKKGKKK